MIQMSVHVDNVWLKFLSIHGFIGSITSSRHNRLNMKQAYLLHTMVFK